MGKNIKGVEIFSVGNWKNIIFTEKDLDTMIKAFNDVGFIPPLKLGHDENQKLLQSDGMPAAGWVANIYRKGKKLIADFKDIPEKIADLIKKGAYRQISSEIYFDFSIANKTFSHVLRAVALLGADNPAISNLKPIDPFDLYKNTDVFFKTYNFDFKIDVPENNENTDVTENIENSMFNLFIFAETGIQFIIGKVKGQKFLSKTQSVLFDKNKWSVPRAKKWLSEHKLHSDKIDITKNKLRFRQRNPKDFDKLKTITLGELTDKKETKEEKMDNNTKEKNNVNKNTSVGNTTEKDFAEISKNFSNTLKEELKKQKDEFSEALTKKDKELKSMSANLIKMQTERNMEKINSIVSDFIEKGKLKPAIKTKVFTLLSTLINSKNDTVKFKDDSDKEVESNLFDIAIDIFSNLDKCVEFKETAKKSKNIDTHDDVSVELTEKTNEYLKKNKMPYSKFSEASQAVLREDSDLALRYRESFYNN